MGGYGRSKSGFKVGGKGGGGLKLSTDMKMDGAKSSKSLFAKGTAAGPGMKSKAKAMARKTV